ncbi:alcohol dehydrogenase catalytic domain-containing protein [Sphingomonas sp. RP10(2022)]|uniref:Alcohol dehydrogenase catalytic domain-containing protein n=1 Tax=Sphingomonas liriopis TaxID=2949094 RepID=A0A9X2HPE0_9SPHN|nr:alcohol dehydrogenase catalytic domain-containing protein [Sphingomonas liriopis]MCP3733312.1 alcohol dehydrogenase catalytic domain-containing protein [Sphingomonas liriopis]
MRAAVVEVLEKPLVVRNIPDPECPPDGAIVRIGANGICRTDWHLWTGDWTFRGLSIEPPFVLGHEFAGIVEEVGSEVGHWKKGDRVVYPMNLGCGDCAQCRNGHQHICDIGHTLVPGVSFWGAFAEYSMVRYADENFVRVPDSMSLLDAASLGCRYMAAFRAVVDQANTRGGEWVAVHGCGGMGLSAIQIAAAVGARVIAVDTSEGARDAAGKLGAAHVIDPRQANPVEAIRDLTRGGVQVSIDALGIAETCLNSVLSLRKRGRHVQIGHTTRVEAGYVPLPIDVILLNELELYGAFGLQGHRYGAMLAMCENGLLDPGKVVSQTVGLDGITPVLEAMGPYDTVGVVAIDLAIEG